MKNIAIFILAILSYLSAFSQEKPKEHYSSYRDSSDKLYWNKNQPMYISVSTSANGSRSERLKSKTSAEYGDPCFLDTEGVNYIRTKWAIDPNTKKLAVPKQEVMWEIYADGISPVSTSTFESTYSKKSNEGTIYSNDLKLKLGSYDKTSGVKTIYYSLNKSAYKIYKSELNFSKEGLYHIKYFAIDKVGNSEPVVEKTFIVDPVPPESSTTITGVYLGRENIVSTSTKIYIEAKDKTSGVKTIKYWIDENTEKTYYKGVNVSLENFDDGKHILYFYAIDHVGNKEAHQNFNFYLDKTAPITVSDILGDKFIVGDKIYFSGRTKLKITSIDNKAGVKSVFYSIDNTDFEQYESPFYMPSKQGTHIVKYYSIDSTENITRDQISRGYYQYKLKIDKIFVDLSGPTLSYKIEGAKFSRGEKIFIGPYSVIRLNGYDGESGLKKITYCVDDSLTEKLYAEPFQFGKLSSGVHQVEYFGYDNVSNRNAKTFEVNLDNTGPSISYQFSVAPILTTDSLITYPEGSTVFLTVQDDFTGISSIKFSVNGKSKLVYQNQIDGFRKGKNLLVVYSEDKLGNMSTKTINFLIE
jgi:hypothetical protein